jgi:uncharacterized protein (TIGR02996 family)
MCRVFGAAAELTVRRRRGNAMDEEEAFLQGIRDAPKDAALRLVYADWLEERDDARCEFLRLLHQRVVATGRLNQLLSNLDSGWVRRVTPRWATEIQQLPTPTDLPRVETGAVQIIIATKF